MSIAIGSAENIEIKCYANEVPAFVEGELDRLYGSLYSSFANFRVAGGVPRASTFLLHCAGQTRALFLFRSEADRLEVLNEGMLLKPDEINAFARFAFENYPDAKKISFRAVLAPFESLRFPFHRSMCSEDIIIDLPESPAAYTARLGASTRKTIKYRLNRLKKKFPTFRFDCHEKQAVREEHVRQVIEFNRARMGEKNKTSVIDDAETDCILSLVRESGFVGIVSIDGRVCAGTITYRIGANHFSRVNAHDPEYNEYRLGMLCCYLTICACIERGARRFHLFHGRYEYKYMLGGTLHLLDNILVYRSMPALVLDAGPLLARSIKSQGMKRFLALEYKAGCKDGWTSQAAAFFVQALRAARHTARQAVALTKGLWCPRLGRN